MDIFLAFNRFCLLFLHFSFIVLKKKNSFNPAEKDVSCVICAIPCNFFSGFLNFFTLIYNTKEPAMDCVDRVYELYLRAGWHKIYILEWIPTSILYVQSNYCFSSLDKLWPQPLNCKIVYFGLQRFFDETHSSSHC